MSRAETAARIIQQADRYKVCCTCESILSPRFAVCPNCRAYRFDSDPETVKETARRIAREETTQPDYDL